MSQAMSDLQWLSGTWFLAASDHPLWTDGKREAPTYTFTPTEKDQQKILTEEIKYIEKGNIKSIHGEDFPHELNHRAFTWTGKSPDGKRECRWEVKLVDETGLWMLTWCEKTDKEPEHVHILTKETQFEEDILSKIKKQMLADATLKDHVPALKKLL
jgi:hypothetical protein